IFISDKRREYVNFTAPYVEVPHLIITRDGGDSFSSMEQLKGRKLAYMRGWVCQDFLEKDYPGIVLSLNDKIEGMIGQVLLGTTDAGLIDLASLGYYSRRHNLSGLRVSMRSPYSPSLAFGFPKDDLPENFRSENPGNGKQSGSSDPGKHHRVHSQKRVS
ncbi:MAG TPA: transporter substrate-binding domain-containing protein, partial [Candidatus Rifleibacterium sp.]|nr:transporter substrate-binding domain-containing protein [Candidatus Rifleibacterium sp.]